VVSWDFAMTQLPGWHSTIFAPYFVAGAIFSGCALVLTLAIPMRRLMKLEKLITIWHLDSLSKVVLLTSIIMSYSYVTESFMVWYAQDPIEMTTFHERYYGPQGYLFWMMIICNCLIPLLLFIPRVRTSPTRLFIISIFVNIGMWLERFVIFVGSLSTNADPSQWKFYTPQLTEVVITIASFGWFLMNFSLFAKFLPIVSQTELKEGISYLKQAVREVYPYRKAA
jgi:Ni/Fe-hydrogenase subunit HybB-like protein